MTLGLRCWGWLVLLFATAAGATPLPAGFAELRAKDEKVARIGFALATGNAPYCDRQTPATGLLLHDLATYGDAAALRASLGLGSDIGVQIVVPGSPAARAGIVPDQTVEAVAGLAVSSIATEGRKSWERLVAIN